jgi:hypothetical protein
MLDSGLTNGDAFPIWCEGGLMSTAKTVTIVDDTKDSIRIGTFDTFDTSTTASCYYPLGISGNGATGTYSLTVRGFYYFRGDTRTKHVMYEQAATLSAHLATANAWTTISFSGVSTNS